jgi:hypothetical protein
VPNEIVIEAMIKGLRPRPMAQYFARKPPQTLKKLLQKMVEYIRADNDFRQRREEAYRFSEMTRGFGGRIHPRHIRSIHNSSQNDDRGSQFQRPQHSSQSSGQQQSSFRPPAPRGRGGRGFGGGYGDQPRKLYSLFCGEDKGHITRTCQVTIQKQKEIAEAEARQNQPKQVLHAAAYVASANNLQLLLLWQVIHKLPGPSSHYHHHCHLLIPEASSQKGTSTPNSSVTLGRSPKLVQSTTLYQSRSIYTEEYPTFDVLLSFMPFYFLCEKQVMKNLLSISCNNCAYTRVKYISFLDLRSSKGVYKETK